MAIVHLFDYNSLLRSTEVHGRINQSLDPLGRWGPLMIQRTVAASETIVRKESEHKLNTGISFVRENILERQ